MYVYRGCIVVLMLKWPMALAFMALTAATVVADDEVALWDLWSRHLQHPEAHGNLVAACREFAAARPEDPLVPVARGIEAWHLLKAQRMADAVTLLESHLAPGAGALEQGANILARAWLSRVDREQVKEALQRYYRKEVRYPEQISDVTRHPRIHVSSMPSVDRWGTAWAYRLSGFAGVPGFRDQRYVLQSIHLGESSDLGAALDVPYAGDMKMTPIRVTEQGPDRTMVQFESEGDGARKEIVAVSVGYETGGLHAAYVGRRLVIVCDRLHWSVYRRPAP